MRTLKLAALALVLVAAAAVYGTTTATGSAFRDRFYTNRHCCDLSFGRALQATIAESRGSVFPSQIGQDKWVLFGVFPGVRDGYFLDVGSADGTLESNSKALEDRGWNGICVDPFPTNMQGRRCAMMKEVVSSASGRIVKFRTSQLLGGIEDTLGKYKDQVAGSAVVEFTTVTVTEILDRNHAPPFINFMSLDIEGAELEALKGIDFERYRFGAMAIEHNDEEPKRSDILKFLDARGYRRVHSFKQDDFYAPK